MNDFELIRLYIEEETFDGDKQTISTTEALAALSRIESVTYELCSRTK